MTHLPPHKTLSQYLLLQLVFFFQAMKPATGVCYLAAKSYYFGVGGSTAHLHTAAAAVGLSVVNVCILDDGRSNKREVLTIRWAAQGGEPAAGKLP